MKWFKCCCCKAEKGEDSFFRDRYRPSGRKPRCKVCEKLYLDPENRKRYEKEYRHKNRERRAFIVRKSVNKNKVHHQEILAQYRKTERFKINHRKHGATRRALERGAFIEIVDYMEIYIKANGFCEYCNKIIDFSEVEFDHYIPISKGGLHKKDNMKCSCLPCNRSKGNKMPEVWEVRH